MESPRRVSVALANVCRLLDIARKRRRRRAHQQTGSALSPLVRGLYRVASITLWLKAQANRGSPPQLLGRRL